MDWMFYALAWPLFWALYWGVASAVRYHRRGAIAQGLAQVAPPEALNNPDELTELRERVKVLERITVDERQARALAEEIENLRDR